MGSFAHLAPGGKAAGGGASGLSSLQSLPNGAQHINQRLFTNYYAAAR